MRYLGIDYGAKRVGVAVSDESGKIAFPKAVLPNTSALAEQIAAMCQKENAGAIVMGESKNFKWKDNPIMADILEFKSNLEKITKLPIYFEPEFMTSEQARFFQGEHKNLDASAAAIILQSYLDRRR